MRFTVILRKFEKYLSFLAERIGLFADRYEFPAMIKEIKNTLDKEAVKKVSTEWVQRKYGIGYVRATRLIEILKYEK